MAVDEERAVAFVRAHGDEFAIARLDWLDGETEEPCLSREQTQRFFAGQREDGGWAPFWAPDYSSLDATCFRLAQCEGLMLGFWEPSVERAVAFLRSRQRADGSWEEDEAVRDLAPPWATPGEFGSRLYLIANCGWWVANASLTGRLVTDDGASRRAGSYLERYLASDGSLSSVLHTHWLAAGLWIRLGQSDLSDRVLDSLATHIDATVPSGALVWMLTTLTGIGLDADRPAIARAIGALNAQQQPDGRWASEDGPERDAYTTAEALRALLMWAAL